MTSPAGGGLEDPGQAADNPGWHTAARARRLVLGLGSNLGDRLRNLQGGVDALFGTPGLAFNEVSPVYETKPVGGPPQPDYLNVVLIAATALSPRAVLERTRGVENAFHRTREIRWGPRTLDIDIIMCGDEFNDDPELILPHPRAHERAFVLLPWLDADPGAELPGRGLVADLAAGLATAGVRRCGHANLRPPPER